MNDISELLLTGLISYGAPMFGLVLLISAAGIPVPSSLLVVAAGAFIRLGILDGYSIGIYGLFGAISGDLLCFGLGKFARSWVLNHFGNSMVWKSAQDVFMKKGSLAIYLTRFLLTGLATPTTLIAGSSNYPTLRFLGYASVGELTWVLLYGGLGFIFGSQWELISEILSDFGGLLLGTVILGAGLFWAVRRTRTTPQPRSLSQ